MPTEGNSAPVTGKIQWIDHYVVCTNDIDRWERFHAVVLGGVTMLDPAGALIGFGLFQSVASCRHGGFIALEPLPSTPGLARGLPRYAYYIAQADIAAHIERLDRAGAVRSDPVAATYGDPGVSIYWQDPDGNQFEFWAPDVLPKAALDGCGPERVGRISHAVFESRDLARTAAFFQHFGELEPIDDARLPNDLLMLRLGGAGRLIFQTVDELGGRTTGCGLRDAHTALVVHNDAYLANYLRVWKELPEWEYDATAGKALEDRKTLRMLPARTAQHPSPGGLRFKALTGRGDDFFDWDTNMFHFYGADPLDDGFARYRAQSVEAFIDDWQARNGDLTALKYTVDLTQR